MAALVYKPLDPTSNTIRLLRVYPGKPHEPLRCVLLHADLHDHLSYVALSYTWGQGSDTCNIQCNGLDIQIGRNLRDFLYRFRSWNVGRKLSLWIDAICINQNDIEERSQQVTKMRDIYSLARSVIAWLGETTVDDTVAYPFVPDRHPGRQWTYKGIIHLLQKPYWSRIWVIQEALLPQFLEVWLGEYRANADELSQIIIQEDVAFIPSGVSRHRTLAVPDVPGINLLETRSSYRAYRDPQNQSFHRHWLWPPSFELRWLIDSFSTSGCSVIHDKVYALLGLVNQNGGPTHDFIPDYNTSTKQLFLQLLENQCASGEPDMWKERDFLNVFRRVLALSREEIARFSLQVAPGVRDSSFVLARGLEITASLQFVDATDILCLPYRYEYWYHTKKGVQPFLPPEVQSAVSSFSTEPKRMRALGKFLQYRWLGSRSVTSSEDAVLLSQRIFIDALAEQSQYSATEYHRSNPVEGRSVAEIMSCAIMKNTEECWASTRQVSRGGDTGEATHPITYLSARQILAEGTRLAMFAGATHHHNALVLKVYTDKHRSPPETRYEVEGIAFLLEQGSQYRSAPSTKIRFQYCNLPSLMDFCRVNVLDEAQLSTILGNALAVERGERLDGDGAQERYKISVGSKENYFENSLDRADRYGVSARKY